MDLLNISNFSNPTGLEYVASVSAIFIGAVILCVAGYFATFRTRRLADFYLYCNTRNNPSNPLYDHLKRKYERRSYVRNTKIGGVWAMVWGIAMLVYFIAIMFNHITPKGTTDLTMNIKNLKQDGYLLEICFDMEKVDKFNYDPNVFRSYRRNVKEDTTLLNREYANAIPKLRDDYFIVENEKHQMKALFIEYYEIVNGKRILLIYDNFFDRPKAITKIENKEFCVKRNIYSLSELKIDANDSKLRLLYLSHPLNKGEHLRTLTSNWIKL